MSHDSSPAPTRMDTILSRLLAQNATLDARQQQLLSRLELPADALGRIAEAATRLPAEQLARARRSLAPRQRDLSVEQWARVSRPDHDELQRSFGARLLRA